MSPRQATAPKRLSALPSSLGVVADDTTGACDVGGALAAGGIETIVELATPGSAMRAACVPVRAVEVREACPERAREEIAAAFATMAGHARSALMLKIDSTFRGHVASMLSGAMAGSGRQAALVAPAFPAQGRHVINGQLTMVGTGAGSAKDLGPLLSRDTSTQLKLRESDLEMPEEELLAHVTDQLASGMEVVIADATGEPALDACARLWAALRDTTLLVGSAGIAAAVAALWRQRVAAEARSPESHPSPYTTSDGVKMVPKPCQRVLVVVGSPAPENNAQIKWLRTLLGRQICEPTETEARGWPTGQPQVRVLSSVDADRSNGERDAGSSSSALASLASSHVGPHAPDGVVLVGGLTARRVLDAVGATAIAMDGEIVPGLPVGRVVGGSWNGVHLVTKAGAFGGHSTMSAAIRALKGVVGT